MDDFKMREKKKIKQFFEYINLFATSVDTEERCVCLFVCWGGGVLPFSSLTHDFQLQHPFFLDLVQSRHHCLRLDFIFSLVMISKHLCYKLLISYLKWPSFWGGGFTQGKWDVDACWNDAPYQHLETFRWRPCSYTLKFHFL